MKASFQVDFGANGPAIAHDINAWVEQITRDKIKDLIAPDSLGALTRMVLVNAVYFKVQRLKDESLFSKRSLSQGFWRTEFEEHSTNKQDFWISKTETKSVEMMHQKAKFFYHEEADVQVCALK